MFDLSYWFWARVFGYSFLIIIIFLRSPIPNPIYALLVQGTVVDRLIEILGIALDWRMFVAIEPYYLDVRIVATFKSGKTETWYLLRDVNIGPLKHRSTLTRMTLACYFTTYTFMGPRLRYLLDDYYAQQNESLSSLKIHSLVLSSLASEESIDRRDNPVRETEVYSWGAS